MRLVINTVGTSLLGFAQRQGLTDKTPEALIACIRKAGEVMACAETNALSRILNDGDRLLFLYSDTEDGEYASHALQEYYKQKGYLSERKRICGLSYSHNRFMYNGLKSLVNMLIDEIRMAQALQIETVINATGGFKAEIAYATLVGLLFKVPVYYIHEIFQDVITMPVTPINWDYSLIAEYKEFFEWIQKEYRRTEKVKSRMQAMPQNLALLLEDDPEGYTTLSPAGQVFFSAFEKELSSSPPIYLSAEAKRFYERLDSTRKKRIDITFDKLRIECLRTGGSGRVGQSDCLVYPRGDCQERLFYYETAEGINICEIAFHGDNYEELQKRGVKRNRYGPFFPVK
jgi:putative CRISPR-associated protein (TIGR02619 family)